MSQPLRDRFGRVARKLRVSVTDRCNLRCFYCMPSGPVKWLQRKELLTYEEITRLVEIFCNLGIREVRITGGEPLVRNQLERLIRMLADLETLESIGLTTNGWYLAEKARSLHEVGVTRLNVSLDTLRPDRFRAVTRRDGLERVLEGIRAARQAGFSRLKVNCVVVRGVNEDEILDLLVWAQEQEVILRFIEFMPLDGDRQWSQQRVVPEREILHRIARCYTVERIDSTCASPATRYRIRETGQEFGIIPSVSRPFCDQCNRIRLTADGHLRTCLFAHRETDLKTLLRSGAGPEAIAERIRAAVWEKGPGHRIGQADFAYPDRSMYAIGG